MATPTGTVALPSSATTTLATLEQLTGFTDEWLRNRRLSDHTRAAYRADVLEYLAWCDARNLPPLAARFTHLNDYGRDLEATPRARGGKPPTVSTVARKLSAVSSWYSFLVKLDALPANPVAGADRPAVDKDATTTVSFTAAEASAMLAAAQRDRYLGDRCAAALLAFLVDLGARVTEVCAIDCADLSHDSGHRTVSLRMKGGKRRVRPMPPALCFALDAYLADRAQCAGVDAGQLGGPLFVTPTGKRVDRFEVYRFVRRAARAAGLPAADRVTPHSFRHAWATIARQAGAGLEDRQFALGHADSRTTQRYDRARLSLDSDPSYRVAAAIAAAERSVDVPQAYRT